MSPPPTRFPLRPRFRGLAWGSLGLGGALTALAAFTPPVVLVSGVCGVVLGGAYLLSPTWRLAVVVTDEALAVVAGDKPRFTLPWTEVQRVLASPSTRTCFVDGGAAERRIIVPGDGAPAPYRIERSAELYDQILARVPASVIEEVELLSDRMQS
jgi:hypothetical protein